jgi:UPF0755 protein
MFNMIDYKKILISLAVFLSIAFLAFGFWKICFFLIAHHSIKDIKAYFLERFYDHSVKITIPEGLTLKEIEDKLKTSGLWLEEKKLDQIKVSDFEAKLPKEFLTNVSQDASLEGYLFPDTYIFDLNNSSDQIINKFLDNFIHQVPAEYLTEAKKQKKDFYQILTMASLLEKEVPDQNERYIASGILWKRISNDMYLQVDAAVCYGLTGDISACNHLKYSDFKFDSPYNTYLHKGLPQGPICNPGLEAIKAALYPEKSPYWYYLSDPKTGKTIFSKNLEEHNKAILKYLR